MVDKREKVIAKPDLSRTRRDKVTLLIAIMAVVSFALRMPGFENKIVEFFAFRQTQTAITVWSYIKEGISLFHYQTPVLGKPWTLPFEFPIYQVCAYFVYQIIRLFDVSNLDIAMRITSLIFFYASAYYFYKIAEELFNNRNISLFALLIYFFSPFSVYWSRASMIEFCAVFFGLAYIYFFIRFLCDSNWKNFVLGFLTGVGGYLAKSTSMVPVCIFLAFYTVEFLWISGYFSLRRFKEKATWFYFARIAALAILPVLPGVAWAIYSDKVKIASGYGKLTSQSLHDWNFGTWKQKTTMENWKKVIKRIFDIIPMWLLATGLIVSPFLFSKRSNYLKMLALVSSSVGGIFICFNLYYIHNYYMCAIFPFISLGGGILMAEIYQLLSPKIFRYFAAVLIVVLFMVYSNVSFYTGFMHMTNKDIYNGMGGWLEVSDYMRENTAENDKMIIFDCDWDSTIPYYSQRKAFMVSAMNTTPLAEVAGDYQWVVCAEGKVSSHLLEMSEIGTLRFEKKISNWNVYRIISTKYDDSIPRGSAECWTYNIESVKPNSDGSVSISGWAAAPGVKISQLWLETEDGKFFSAVYGYDRADVSEYFHDENCRYSGLEVYIPNNTGKVYALHVVYSQNGKEYDSVKKI